MRFHSLERVNFQSKSFREYSLLTLTAIIQILKNLIKSTGSNINYINTRELNLKLNVAKISKVKMLK